MQSLRPNLLAKFSTSFGLLTVLLTVLWFAGGASNADVLGQPIVRGVAWLVLIIATLAGELPVFSRVRILAILLGLAVLLPLLQLVLLPEVVWRSLPGRAVLAGAAIVSDQPQPWRPWSMVPTATINAVGSLVVPVAVFVLILNLKERERRWLPGIVLSLITASMIVGLLQSSGAGFGNALINSAPDDVSGIFANRNHFAVFIGMGCILAPAWAFMGARSPGWRGPVAVGLVLLFVLTILATGSRAGIGVGGLAVVLGLLLARQGLLRELGRARRWVLPTVIVAIVGIITLFVVISISADRAASINRLIAIDAGGDTRVRALPTVLAMVRAYFPFGIGFGGFDPLFRMNEPYDLLKPTYFNHAHNDFLEVVLDGGLPGLALMTGALGWATFASVRAWWAEARADSMIPRAGSAMLLLVAVASIFDYPARTPMMMAMIVIAAMWLAGAEKPSSSRARQ